MASQPASQPALSLPAFPIKPDSALEAYRASPVPKFRQESSRKGIKLHRGWKEERSPITNSDRPPAIQLPRTGRALTTTDPGPPRPRVTNERERERGSEPDAQDPFRSTKEPGLSLRCTPTCWARGGRERERACAQRRPLEDRGKEEEGKIKSWPGRVERYPPASVSGRRYVNQPKAGANRSPRLVEDDSCVPGIPNSSPDYNYKSATLMLMSLYQGERRRERILLARKGRKGATL